MCTFYAKYGLEKLGAALFYLDGNQVRTDAKHNFFLSFSTLLLSL